MAYVRPNSTALAACGPLVEWLRRVAEWSGPPVIDNPRPRRPAPSVTMEPACHLNCFTTIAQPSGQY